jgi:hypothetical protein
MSFTAEFTSLTIEHRSLNKACWRRLSLENELLFVCDLTVHQIDEFIILKETVSNF